MNVILDLSTTIQQFKRQFQLPVIGSTQIDRKAVLMKYNEKEYFQHQCDSVNVKCENQMS